MTPEEIAKDKAICEAATPGPWIRRGRLSLDSSVESEAKDERGVPRMMADLSEDVTRGDADFIAHARDRLPVYIAEAEEMAKRIAALREQIKRRDESDRYDDQRGFTNGLREALAAITGGQ